MTNPTFAAARQAVHEATHALLGDTIQLADADWRAPCALPGWTRAHLGTHLARNAEGLVRVLIGLHTDTPVYQYDSSAARAAAIAEGASRAGVAIQQDLDETADRLTHAMDEVSPDQWTAPLALSETLVLPQADLVVLHRLNEVVIHHIDLNVGVAFADLDPVIAGWLLDRNLWRITTRHPELNLVVIDETGTTRAIGSAPRDPVSGSRQNLLGWLLGRLDPTVVSGPTELTLPSL